MNRYEVFINIRGGVGQESPLSGKNRNFLKPRESFEVFCSKPEDAPKSKPEDAPPEERGQYKVF